MDDKPRAGLLAAQTNAAYHARTDLVSNSMLKVFRESIPAYHARFVSKTAPEPGWSADLHLGMALHTLILEPEKFDEQVVVIDPPRGTKTKAREAAAAANPEKAVIEPDDLPTLRAMAVAAWANPAVAVLLDAPGRVELPVWWTDPTTDIACKAKLDKVVDGESPGTATIVDIKTTSDPSPEGFARSVVNFGYHRQEAFYRQAAFHALGLVCQVVFVAVGKDEPHEAVAYELDGEARHLGTAQVAADLTRLASCRAYGLWTGRYHGERVTLSLPRYAFSAQ